MCKNVSEKTFATRSVVSFFVIMLLLFTCVLRIAVIAEGNYKELQENQTLYRINVARLRGTIYDCNMIPITNNKSEIVAAVLPIDNTTAEIVKYIKNDSVNELKTNKPIVCYVTKKLTSHGINSATVYKTENTIACHIIGYVNSEGHGVSGLERAYDKLLYSDKKLSANFTTNGKGNTLNGIEPYFENDLSVINDGLVTTLDTNIQTIAENALSKLNSGCVIVTDVKNSKIRAMASVPTYNTDNIAEYLSNDNSPMLNRALECYNIGSVFKPCVAAALIENKYQDIKFDCFGSLEIDGRKFRCHKLDGHGYIDLCSSLAQSCNCFFYNSAIALGGKKIYDKAAAISLESKIKIADNLYTKKGNLPMLSDLNTKGAIANLSIGQGELMASPIAMLNLYLAIAGDGSYYIPSIVEKTIKNGKIEKYSIGYKTRVMLPSTAQTLREYLKTVITDGTGNEAAPSLCEAAGKTATAQTGRYYNDKTEITNSWFCGFFPADEPEYVAVIMSDSKSDVSTASIFAEIADNITESVK